MESVLLKLLVDSHLDQQASLVALVAAQELNLVLVHLEEQSVEQVHQTTRMLTLIWIWAKLKLSRFHLSLLKRRLRRRNKMIKINYSRSPHLRQRKRTLKKQQIIKKKWGLASQLLTKLKETVSRASCKKNQKQ